MCWTAPVSLAIGTAGIATAAYAHKKGESSYITLPLFYFSLMELLQFASYYAIGQCGLESNSILTLLSYIHISFQPIFVNMFLMHSFITKPSWRVRRVVYGLCLVVTAIMLLKLIPFNPSSLCQFGQTICGPTMCTLKGSWHLAWSVPQYNIPIPGDSFIYYASAAVLLPLVYGAWIGVIYFVISGPVLAYWLAGGNPQEWPSIWCLYSVFLILVTFVLHLHRRRHSIGHRFAKWRR